MLTLLLALCLPSVAAAADKAKTSEQPISSTLDALEARITGLMDDLDRSTKRLREIDDGIAASSQEEALISEGSALTRRLHEGFEEVNRLRTNQRKLREVQELLMFTRVVRGEPGGESMVAGMIAPHTFAGSALSDRRRRLYGAYQAEAARWNQLADSRRRAEERRRLLHLWGGIALALAAYAAVFLVLRVRRRARTAAQPPPEGLFRLLGPVETEPGAEAYEAEDLALGRKVVVRRLVTGPLEGPRDLERLLAGAQAAAALKHPHIAGLYSIVPDAKGPLLAFEHVPGPALRQVLEERGSLPWPQAVGALAQAAAALDYAHSLKVVHGCLTPSRIILAPSDGVKLTGFGLAAAAEAPYAAPEQSRGPATAASDQFSLAVCFREMAGRAARTGLEDVLGRALAVEPGKRYGSCSELAAAVAALAPRSTRMRQ